MYGNRFAPIGKVRYEIQNQRQALSFFSRGVFLLKATAGEA